MFTVLCAFLDFAADVREALQKSNTPLKAAAIDMGMDESQLVKQLKGDGHLSARRLAFLPIEFHQWLNLIRARRVGLPGEVHAAVAVKGRMEQAS